MEVVVSFRRKEYVVEDVQSTTRVGELKERVAQATEVPKQLQKLVWKGERLDNDGKTLQDIGCPDGGRVGFFLMGSKEKEVMDVQTARPDATVKPFEGSAPRRAKRTVPNVRQQSSKYTFAEIETLPGLPDESRARQILEDLKNDRGIAAMMNKRMWTVGKLKEMYPAGQEGIDPVCVLGFNINQGQEIHLRLRTDDLQGFRHYWRIKEVLFHELSHNVHSDHNRDFYDLMSTIQKEAKALDWTQSTGRSVGDHSGQRRPSRLQENEAPNGTVVGGKITTRINLSAREASAQAAIARLTLSSREASQDGPKGAEQSDTLMTDSSSLRDARSERCQGCASLQVGSTVYDGAAMRHKTLSTCDESDKGPKSTEHSDTTMVDATGARAEPSNDLAKSLTGSRAVNRSPSRVLRKKSSREMELKTGHDSGVVSTEMRENTTVASEKTTQVGTLETPSPLSTLLAMGFQLDLANRALDACEGDTDRAANWLFSRQLSTESNVQTPQVSGFNEKRLPVEAERLCMAQSPGMASSATPASVPAPATRDAATGVDELVSMGFPRAHAEAALRSTAGDMEAAVNWIVSRGLS